MTHVEPLHEEERLAALASYEILDTPPERVFDDIARIAAQICDVPIAVVSLVDRDRQWSKASFGAPATTSTPREIAFCAQAIQFSDTMVVGDARTDARFHDNPMVLGEPHIAFYAGAQLLAPNGHRLGTLCVIDRKPRELAPAQQLGLKSLARLVVDALEHRRIAASLAASLERVRTLESLLQMCSNCKAVRVDDTRWVPFEEHLHRRSGTLVSHGLCPDCA